MLNHENNNLDQKQKADKPASAGTVLEADQNETARLTLTQDEEALTDSHSKTKFFDKLLVGKAKLVDQLLAGKAKKSPEDFATYLDYMDYRSKCRARRKMLRRITAGACCLALAVGVAWGGTGLYQYLAHGGKAYAINVNEHQIALVKNEKIANQVVADYLAKESKLVGEDVYISERLDLVPVNREDNQVLDPEEAEAVLAKKVTPVMSGVAIVADGKTVVDLADEKEAQKALQYLKDAYVPQDNTLKVIDCKFQEDVEIVAKYVPVEEVYDKNDAKLVLKGTAAKESYFYVAKEGDSLESIAKSQSVTTRHLLDYNDWIDFNHLQPGDKVKIKAEKPAINVVTVLAKTKEAAIPYKTVYKTDRSAAAGTQTVAQEGVNGKEKVELKLVRVNGEESYRERTNSQVLEVAVEKVVVKGAAPTTSSRGSTKVRSGNGGYAWPTKATRISSYYGARSRGFHTGIDIDGDYGDPVWASRDGTVKSAGWAGGYGYCVVLDHGGGVSTRYAHLSSISVKKGESVSAGTYVGKIGSTGNSTGSHLHFEVIINGKTQNPLSYL